MNLTLQQSEVDTSTFVMNKNWFLANATAQRNEIFYECCPEPYLDIAYRITLDKRGYTLKSSYC